MRNKDVLIICESIYKGNTYKLAEAMGQKLSCKVVSPKEAEYLDLKSYKIIGLGSGIYFTAHHPNIMKIIDRLHMDQKVFVFSTHGAPYLGKYHDAIKSLLTEKGIQVIGEYSTKGYDCTGPFIIVGGVNKNRPNLRDEVKAKRFVAQILPTYIKESQIVPKGHFVQVDNDCIGCNICVSVCALDVFEMQNSRSVAINEKECTHCSLCVEKCPMQAISIRHNFREAIGIAAHHVGRKSL
jgi:ferredoxin